MTVSKQDFRDAMARLGAAVNIITTDGPGGRGGFTASAVCSVTDEPPTLLVCMNRNATAAPALKANGNVCVNVVAAGQKDTAMVFAGVTKCTMLERFEAGTWATLATGAPVLQGAVVSFDCKVVDVVEKGTHLVVFGEVQGIRAGSVHDHGLIYFGRDYHPVGKAATAG
ncbi:flavin reductase [Siccirubricoccus sp. KC 17139]|uniref:Flavin reductase n=1 Tax=Siccirubricoccus soli TaxID=2899147 RepID=A0ABT1D7G4_9PROT|nr:flavin reductase [Siccirubricoccus soli]MCO6416925.1 flavin reductase [Siccirubricoccus soli]MCP2683060.1 flavin reductase [Siccirubricoccus soli]